MTKKIKIEEIREFAYQSGYKLLSKSYINAKRKLYFLCSKHGVFSMNWNNFKSGQRCRKCSESSRFSWSKSSIKKFLRETEFTYFGHRKEDRRVFVTVNCSNGHLFETRLDSLQRGQGCLLCFNGSLSLKYDFIKNYIENLRCGDYRLITKEYKNQNQYLEIKCSKHGIFKKKYCNIRKSGGCPKCLNFINKEEEKCRNIIERLTGKKFPSSRLKELTNPRTNCRMELDGYCKELGMAFEYDGIQHFEPVSYFGGKDRYDKRVVQDEIKNELCKKAGIFLIRIPYYIKDKESFIKDKLNENKD